MVLKVRVGLVYGILIYMNITYALIILSSWIVFVVTWAVSAYNVKPDQDRSARLRLRLFRVATVLLVVVAAQYFNQLGRGAWLIDTTHFAAAIPRALPLGAALTVFGIALAIWARLHLGRNWSPHPAVKEGHELITSGPYRLVRHPIYTGILLALLGSVATGVWLLVVFVAVGATFVWRVKVEERLMRQQFPEQYMMYQKHTWALVPYVW